MARSLKCFLVHSPAWAAEPLQPTLPVIVMSVCSSACPCVVMLTKVPRLNDTYMQRPTAHEIQQIFGQLCACQGQSSPVDHCSLSWSVRLGRLLAAYVPCPVRDIDSRSGSCCSCTLCEAMTCSGCISLPLLLLLLLWCIVASGSC